MSAGMELWKLLSYQNLPMYTHPYVRTISLSAGVGVASLHMKPISTKQTYSRVQLAVGDMLRFSRALLFRVFRIEPSKLKVARDS